MREFPSQIITRVSDEDRERLVREAKREGLNISSFVRSTLMRELREREKRETAQAYG